MTDCDICGAPATDYDSVNWQDLCSECYQSVMEAYEEIENCFNEETQGDFR